MVTFAVASTAVFFLLSIVIALVLVLMASRENKKKKRKRDDERPTASDRVPSDQVEIPPAGDALPLSQNVLPNASQRGVENGSESRSGKRPKTDSGGVSEGSGQRNDGAVMEPAADQAPYGELYEPCLNRRGNRESYDLSHGSR